MTAAGFSVALVWFGDAGGAFVQGWNSEDCPESIAAFDLKTDAAATRDRMPERYASHDVHGCASVDDAIGDADAVFSVVTAEQALGLPLGMSAAASDWQSWNAGLGKEPGDDDLCSRLDRVLPAR